jgi:pimeloyl-ACP methyl ester carboxylesterase
VCDPAAVEGFVDRPDGARWWRAIEGPTDGAPLVLVPPGNRNAAVWPPVWLARLHVAGWCTLRVDLPGQGRSRLRESGFGVDQVAGELLAVVEEALPPSRRVHVVGAGLGGVVAMALAERARLASLTLVATSGWYADPSMPGAEEPVMVSLLLRQERHTPELLRRALIREVRALAGPHDRERADTWPQHVDGWLAHGIEADDPHRRALLEAAPRWDGLAALRLPTTVVHGGDDPLIPPAHAERLAASIPGAALRLVDGAGHHLGPALLGAVADALEGRRREGAL